jgi:hypothetical protein
VRCDQCKHWRSTTPPKLRIDDDNEWDERDDDSYILSWEAKAAGFGECKAVREGWKIMDAAASEYTSGDRTSVDGYVAARIAALKAEKAYVMDGSQYHASLLTAPDFFCARFAKST